MKKAELIIIPSPGVGHLVAILEFAKLLINRSSQISVTVLVTKLPNTPYVESSIKSLTESRIRLINLPQVDPPSLELLKECPEHYLTACMENQLQNIRTLVSDIIKSSSVPVTGFIVDMFCLGLIDVAIEFNLPSYLFMTSNCMFLNFMVYLMNQYDQNVIRAGFDRSGSDLVIPGFVNPVPVSVMPNFSFKESGYVTFVELTRRLRDLNGVLVNTFYELEPLSIDVFKGDSESPTVYTVGPVMDLKGQGILDKTQTSKIMKWLDDQPECSVVFLCFGSKGSFTPSQVKEMAIGLEQSGYRFLLCYKLSSPDDDALGRNQWLDKDIFPDGFLDRIEGRGMVCNWAPQVEVLAHKATGAFVSHCGWNSILESLWHGVPILTWPLYAEQQLDAFQLVKELGLAVELRLDTRRGGETVPAKEIAEGVKRVMGEHEVRNRVKEMSEISRKSVMEGGSSFASLGRFIDLNF